MSFKSFKGKKGNNLCLGLWFSWLCFDDLVADAKAQTLLWGELPFYTLFAWRHQLYYLDYCPSLFCMTSSIVLSWLLRTTHSSLFCMTSSIVLSWLLSATLYSIKWIIRSHWLSKNIFSLGDVFRRCLYEKKKHYSTQYSHVVTDRSTDWAVTNLTSEIGRDPVLYGTYGSNT